MKGYANDAWFANDANLQALQQYEGVWLKGDRIVVPNVSHVRSALLWDYRDSPLPGHLGVNKTLHNLQRSFWWQGMFTDISNYICTCVSCQRSKRSATKPAGLLQPLHVPKGPWDSVSTDFITGLPKTKAGFDAIVVFVDKFTKNVHLLVAPTTTKCTAQTWAELFMQLYPSNPGLNCSCCNSTHPILHLYPSNNSAISVLRNHFVRHHIVANGFGALR